MDREQVIQIACRCKFKLPYQRTDEEECILALMEELFPEWAAMPWDGLHKLFSDRDKRREAAQKDLETFDDETGGLEYEVDQAESEHWHLEEELREREGEREILAANAADPL